MSYPSFSHLAFQRSPVADPFHLPLTPSLTPCSLVDTHHSRRLYLIPSSILIIPNAYTLHPRPYPSFPTLIPYTLVHTHHSQRLYLTPSSIPTIPNAYTLHPHPYPSFPTLIPYTPVHTHHSRRLILYTVVNTHHSQRSFHFLPLRLHPLLQPLLSYCLSDFRHALTAAPAAPIISQHCKPNKSSHQY